MKRAALMSLLCLGQVNAQAPHEAASSLAEHYARAYGVPAEFVKAVIDAESGWQPYVISTKGAAGIMHSRRRQHSPSE